MGDCKKNVVRIQGEKPGLYFDVDIDYKPQAKYEMLREAALTGEPVAKVAKKYGYSRRGYYETLARWEESRFEGLTGEKRGPKGPSKRTPELEQQALRMRFCNPDKDVIDIATELSDSGYDVSVRTLSRIYGEHGITLKKTAQLRHKGRSS